MGYTLNFGVIWDNLDRLLAGLALGLGLALVSIAIGALAGLALRLRQRRAARVLRGAGRRPTSPSIRNTPILVIVLIVYFALPQLGIRLGKIESFVFSLADLRGGLPDGGVPRRARSRCPPASSTPGARSACAAHIIALLVVFPIMLRNSLPALGSTFISLFKDTSIAAAIAMPELTFEARKINVESFRVIETWLVGDRPLCRDLRADGRRPAAPRAALSALLSTRMDGSCTSSGSSAAPLLDGLVLTIEISAASIVVGSAIGLIVGMALAYGAASAALALPLLCRRHPRHAGARAGARLLLRARRHRHPVLGGAGRHLRAVDLLRRAYGRDRARRAAGDPAGQIEAARSIGLKFPQILRLVLLPQALRQIVPVWINVGAELVKASTLLSIIGVGELLLKTQQIVGRNFMTLEFYLVAGVLYFAVNFCIERLGKYAERRMAVEGSPLVERLVAAHATPSGDGGKAAEECRDRIRRAVRYHPGNSLK